MEKDKKRCRNFSRQELEVMVDEINVRKKLLLGKINNMGITAEDKTKGSAKVAEARK